ncbi:hypothetical protein ABIE76_002401 [Sinorhizobium fredii]
MICTTGVPWRAGPPQAFHDVRVVGGHDDQGGTANRRIGDVVGEVDRIVLAHEGAVNGDALVEQGGYALEGLVHARVEARLGPHQDDLDPDQPAMRFGHLMPVVQLSDRAEHPLDGFRSDPAAIVDDPLDRRRADAGLPGHVLQGHFGQSTAPRNSSFNEAPRSVLVNDQI